MREQARRDKYQPKCGNTNLDAAQILCEARHIRTGTGSRVEAAATLEKLATAGGAKSRVTCRYRPPYRASVAKQQASLSGGERAL